ncbi:unnamed protein product [Ixodes pacificus]
MGKRRGKKVDDRLSAFVLPQRVEVVRVLVGFAYFYAMCFFFLQNEAIKNARYRLCKVCSSASLCTVNCHV